MHDSSTKKLDSNYIFTFKMSDIFTLIVCLKLKFI